MQLPDLTPRLHVCTFENEEDLRWLCPDRVPRSFEEVDMDGEVGHPPTDGPGSKARLVFTRTAWEQYLSHTDRKLIKRINNLLDDIVRNGYDGIGKPEPLRGELSGFWSRRIDQEHRLVYRITGNDVEIVACRYHY